ncbi:LOW QUALITY PROTEIN: E3 ubiquitin-protein ligase RNF115 [Danio aesculapii]|uniref:LOW QUALITY PROTEIN: E3 ubiquitin-protein ligase RNF115 n=1 Tax=Danio aesculapii TaxID=1142201 RepID=UPI0024C0836F|nr:LOW QUALITY PROTEIN: E3 ubiquitin-protein ligase RNF115 [Danio aesculapii]
MAEAAAAPRHRFFCHCCKGEIDPKLPEYVCPRCESGFIEEVSENFSLLQNQDGAAGIGSDDVTSQFAELWQLLFMEHSALLSEPSVTDALRSSGLQPTVADPASGTAGPVASVENLSDCTEPQQNNPQTNSRQDQGQAVEGIVQQFLAGLFSNSDSAGPQTSSWSSALHSNPGDYAWGQGGLDAVVTQLLGQSENSGPPPAEKEMISSLPTVSISSEQTACRLECPVCREEFSVGESVRQLPCLHYFHSSCIVPWLQLHDTCPVCRKSLDGEDRGFQPRPDPQETIPSPPDLPERSTFETL